MTVEQETLINDWLSGNKAVKTDISLVVRWNSAAEGWTFQKSGQTHYFLLDSPSPERDLQVLSQVAYLSNQGMALFEEKVDSIYDVRWKRAGIAPDLSFRASSLELVWDGYYGFLKKKELVGRSVTELPIRFYLRIDLFRGSTSLQVKSGWYKIKSVSPISSTGRTEGADARIEAIPWIYEYNNKLRLGNSSVPWISPAAVVPKDLLPKGMYMSDGGTAIGASSYFGEWFSPSISTNVTSYSLKTALSEGDSILEVIYLRAHGGLGNLVVETNFGGEFVIWADSRYPDGFGTVKSFSTDRVNLYVEFEENAELEGNPIPNIEVPLVDIKIPVRIDNESYWDTEQNGKAPRVDVQRINDEEIYGASVTLSYFNSWNGVSRIQRIEHDRNINPLRTAPCSYLGPMYCYVGAGLDISDAEVLNYNMDMGARRILGGGEQTPLTYMARWAFTNGLAIRPTLLVDIDNPFDAPFTEMYALGDFLRDSLSREIPVQWEFSDLEGESDATLLSDVSYFYVVSDYSVQVGVDRLAENIALGEHPIRILELSVESIPIRISKGSLISVDLEATDKYFSELVPVSTIRGKDWVFSRLTFYTQYVFSSGGSLDYYSEDPRGVTIQEGYILPCFCKMISSTSETYIGDVENSQSIKLDFNAIFSYNRLTSLPNSVDGKGLLTEFSKVRHSLSFQAELRPWINIYDLIKVHVRNNFGQEEEKIAFVTSIDANLDTMTANYTAYVIENQ